MKRNLDLLREILLVIESQESGEAPHPLHVEGYTWQQIGYHCYLLVNSGLVSGPITTTANSGGPTAIATHMTSAGHDFLDAARDKGRWKEALRLVQEKGGDAVTLGVLTQLLTSLAKKALGLP